MAPGGGRRGRPLDADRTPAILDAVLALLKDSGYDQLRIQDVAEHAGVGLGTIYRRWPNKQALVIEALQCGRFIDEKLVDTGDPAADIVATLLNLGTAMAGQGDVIGFIASIRREPDIAAAWRSIAVCNLRDRLRDLVVAARQCDPDDPSLDTVTDLGPALILYRIAVIGDTDDVESLARDAVRHGAHLSDGHRAHRRLNRHHGGSRDPDHRDMIRPSDTGKTGGCAATSCGTAPLASPPFRP